MSKTKSGFTIVELLIVIVVIAILAAITIVAYNGVQNRTYDTTIQSDLRNMGQLVEQFNVINGHYPTSTTEIVAANLKASKNSYKTEGVNNIIYCTDGTQYGFAALSKSGKAYQYTSTSGIGVYSATWTNASGSTCSPALVTSYTWFLWGYNGGTWVAAIGG